MSSPDQIEAARLDGAKGWKMLWYIILPQLRPATFIAFVVTVIGALQVLRPGLDHDRRRAVRLEPRAVSFYMYEQALSEYGYRMGYGAAIAVILFLIMMVFISGFIWKMVSRRKGGNLRCFHDPSNKHSRPRPSSATRWRCRSR
jgi:multiple sugar transport system permease protein